MKMQRKRYSIAMDEGIIKSERIAPERMEAEKPTADAMAIAMIILVK